jgi:hypothetical protein
VTLTIGVAVGSGDVVLLGFGFCRFRVVVVLDLGVVLVILAAGELVRAIVVRVRKKRIAREGRCMLTGAPIG